MAFVQRDAEGHIIAIAGCPQYDLDGTPIAIEEVPDAEAILWKPPTYHLNNGALIRFTATPPITVLENIGMAGVARLTKGRFRITHAVPMPTENYSVFPDVMDAADKRIRYTARTVDYVEVKVVDTAGNPADAQEVSLKVERVIST